MECQLTLLIEKLLVFLFFLLILIDVFRPFPGYKTVRLIKKQTQSGREYYYCFADFENSIQSTIALNTLQVNFIYSFSLIVLIKNIGNV